MNFAVTEIDRRKDRLAEVIVKGINELVHFGIARIFIFFINRRAGQSFAVDDEFVFKFFQIEMCVEKVIIGVWQGLLYASA